MRFVDTWFSREQHYALGREGDSGEFYASIPVTAGIVDYEEYYRLTPSQFLSFLASPSQALPFIEECRQRRLDHLLMIRPGPNRGNPY